MRRELKKKYHFEKYGSQKFEKKYIFGLTEIAKCIFEFCF